MTAFVAWWRVCHTVATPARVWRGTYQGVRCGRLWTAAKSTIQTPRWSTAPVLHTSTAPVVSWGSSAAVWVTSRQTCSQSVSTKLKKDQSYTKIFCWVRFGKCKGQWKPLRCPLMLLFFGKVWGKFLRLFTCRHWLTDSLSHCWCFCGNTSCSVRI